VNPGGTASTKPCINGAELAGIVAALNNEFLTHIATVDSAGAL
jgi:hypothetical protein